MVRCIVSLCNVSPPKTQIFGCPGSLRCRGNLQCCGNLRVSRKSSGVAEIFGCRGSLRVSWKSSGVAEVFGCRGSYDADITFLFAERCWGPIAIVENNPAGTINQSIDLLTQNMESERLSGQLTTFELLKLMSQAQLGQAEQPTFPGGSIVQGQQEPHPLSYRIWATIIHLTIFILGVAGNIVLVIVVRKTKSLQSSTYCYLVIKQEWKLLWKFNGSKDFLKIVLMGFGGFWWVLMDFDGFWWILVGSDGLWWILMDFGGFWWVLMGFDPICSHVLRRLRTAL